FDACSADYSQIAIALGQGRPTMLAARFTAANYGRHFEAAPGMTISTAEQARKADELETLLEAGLFTVNGSGLSTTLTSAVAKDANVFPVTSADGVAQGNWYVVEGGGRKQVLWVESVNSLNVTVRTRAAYAFPSGSTF